MITICDGEMVGLVEVLRGEQHVGAVGDQRADRVPQLDAAARIETGGRLVEQQQPGPADEAGAEVEAAAHAAGVRAHRPVGGVGEAQLLEHGGASRRGAGARVAEQPGDHLDVLPPGHGGLDRGVLAGEATRRRTAAGWRATSMPATWSVPGVGPEQGGDKAHERRLAGAVGSEQRHDLARGAW